MLYVGEGGPACRRKKRDFKINSAIKCHVCHHTHIDQLFKQHTTNTTKVYALISGFGFAQLPSCLRLVYIQDVRLAARHYDMAHIAL